MTTSTDLCYLTLHELAQGIQAKEISPVEATEATLERIERLNPKLNAYITVMADEALAQARTAAGEIAAGRYRGALHGVPVGVKDLFATKGVRTTAGSKVLVGWVPDEDAEVVTRLRESGAIIVGKLHLHEFAFGATGVNEHYGPCRNPWDTERITGGSSSGSGSAVAAGLCFAATGSDTGGSIRVPSSLCGVAGLKPAYGRVSLRGVVPLSWSLDHVGPMARTARDCALLLEAIAGYDPQDPSSAEVPVEEWSEQIDGGIAGLRIGVPMEALDRAEEEVAAAVRAAIETLRRLGAEIVELDLLLAPYWQPTATVLLAEAAAYHQENFEKRRGDYGDVAARIQSGLETTSADYIKAARFRDEVRRTCDEVFLPGVDLLALPTTLRTAPTIEEALQKDPTLGLTMLTGQFDLSGQPAMSVPCGFTSGGLPVGLQLVGRRFDEATVLRAAHTFEQAAGVSGARPALD